MGLVRAFILSRSMSSMRLSPMPKVMMLRLTMCSSERVRRKSTPPCTIMAFISLGGPGRISTCVPSGAVKPQPGAVPQVL